MGCCDCSHIELGPAQANAATVRARSWDQRRVVLRPSARGVATVRTGGVNFGHRSSDHRPLERRCAELRALLRTGRGGSSVCGDGGCGDQRAAKLHHETWGVLLCDLAGPK